MAENNIKNLDILAKCIEDARREGPKCYHLQHNVHEIAEFSYEKYKAHTTHGTNFSP